MGIFFYLHTRLKQGQGHNSQSRGIQAKNIPSVYLVTNRINKLEIVNLSHILPDQSAISAKEEFQATLEDISNFQETLLNNDVEQEAHKETFREMPLPELQKH